MKFQVFQFFLNLDDFWSYFNGFAGCLEPLVPWPLFWFTKRFRNVHLQIYLKSQGLLRKHSFFTFSNFFNFLSKSNGFPRCLHFDAPWPLFLFFECLRNTSFQFCFELMRPLNDAERYREIRGDTEFRVQSSEFIVQRSDFKVQRSEFRV